MSDSDIVQDFLVESYENLDRLDRELVGLEKKPHDRNALGSLFRTIHTIKGTCGFLGFNKLEKVAHVGENLLTRLRDGQLTLNPELTTALLGMVDAVRQMLKEIQATGQDGEVDYPELRENLTRLQQAGAGSESPAHLHHVPSPVPEEAITPESLEDIPSKNAAAEVIASSPSPVLKKRAVPKTPKAPKVPSTPLPANPGTTSGQPLVLARGPREQAGPLEPGDAIGARQTWNPRHQAAPPEPIAVGAPMGASQL